MLRKLIKFLEEDLDMYTYICVKIVCYITIIAYIIVLAMEK